MTIQIYILVPNEESVTNWFPSVLIWSDSEDNARRNAESITLAQDRDRTPLTENDLNIFQDTAKSSCRALDSSEYEIIQHDNDSVQIRYEGKVYNLTENESEHLMCT